MKIVIKSFFLSISFLSRIPLPDITPSEKEWKIMPAFFPIVASIICGISALPAFLIILGASKLMINWEIADAFASIIFIAFNFWLTRALHIDGFCDSVDAYSVVSADKETRLKIMKDPHCGSSAISALIILLTIKFIAVFFLFRGSRFYDFSLKFPLTALILLLIAVSFAKFAMAFLAFIGKYPRKNGTAMNIVGQTKISALIFAFFSATTPFFFLKFDLLSLAKIATCIVLAIFFNVIYWFVSSKRVIGGVTGDILGAISETTETSLLAIFAVALTYIFC